MDVEFLFSDCYKTETFRKYIKGLGGVRLDGARVENIYLLEKFGAVVEFGEYWEGIGKETDDYNKFVEIFKYRIMGKKRTKLLKIILNYPNS